MENNKILEKAWFMLVLRLLLFAGIQAAIALLFFLLGKNDPWNESANWWPIVVGLANLVCLYFLVRFFKAEGSNFWSLFQIKKENIGKDLLVLVAFLILAAPLSYLPNVLLAKWLFGDANATLTLFFRPLPLWAVTISLIFFPLTQGLVEIPTYMLYVSPRLEKAGYKRWLAVLLPALFLSIQHIAVPLLFNGRFIIWRLLMYLPFAILVAVLMRWRPRFLPYMALTHILMDAATAVMLLAYAY